MTGGNIRATLEFRCMPIEVDVVLLLRMMSNCLVIRTKLQSFCLFHGTIVTDTLE